MLLTRLLARRGLSQSAARPGGSAAPRERSNLLVAAAATCFGLLMASVPLVVRVMQRERMIDADKALTGSQIQRGVYINSGSKDVGAQPGRARTTRSVLGSSSLPALAPPRRRRSRSGVEHPDRRVDRPPMIGHLVPGALGEGR